MSSVALYRIIAVIVFALIGGLSLELGFFGPQSFELDRLQSNRGQLVAVTERLADITAQLAALPALPDRSKDQVTYAEDTAESSLMLFQETVQGLVASNGALPMAQQASQENASPNLVKLKVLVRAIFNEQALLSFLRQIESSRTHISVTKLEVIPPGIGEDSSVGLNATIVLEAIHSHAD